MTKTISALLACAAGTFAATAASAEDQGLVSEVKLGVFAHDTGPFGVGKEDGASVNAEVLFASPALLRRIGKPRPHLGLTYATDADATSQAYFGLTWEWDPFEKFFVYGSLGGAVHNGDPLTEPENPTSAQVNDVKYLGCSVLFRESAGVGYRLTRALNISFHLDHISNGRLCDNNEGLDNVGVRIGWRPGAT